ncbi:hypothetical protein [uncultured Methanobrevibacter sp.]|uniref:hypothetical protein n=1 Tax=uncultured Methanobrevibacter sp. TaxID=253161 RepID=UPI0025D1BFFF|nr:hypothetical protein [uncultured Methanobrevibacter sp.]
MSKLTNAEKDKLDNTCGNLRVTKLGTHVKSLEDFVNEMQLDTRADTVAEAINELYSMIVDKDCEAIQVPPPGFFTLWGNDEDGKLYCYYNDEDHPPLFRHVETPGEDEGTLYLYIADPEGDNHYEMEIGHYIAVKHLENYYNKSQSNSRFGVTVEKKSKATDGFAESYVVKQNGSQVGVTIDIPKDFFLKGGSVKTCTVANVPVQGYIVGDKYLDMEINVEDGGATTKHMYILLKDLAPLYRADESTLTLSNDNVFSVKNGGITMSKLASDVQDAINSKADGGSFEYTKVTVLADQPTGTVDDAVYYLTIADTYSGYEPGFYVWDYDHYVPFHHNGKEDKSNKVTSISSSSTDTQYPSAKLLYDRLGLKQDKSSAFSGDYNDLTHKPSIPTKTSDLINTSGFITEHQDISGKEDKTNKVTTLDSSSTDTQYPSAKCVFDELADKLDVSDAFSGDYDDLTHKPSIPTKTSDLVNDGDGNNDFVTKSSTSGLIKNDGTIDTNAYLTQHQDISGKEDKTNKVTSWTSTPTDTHYPSEKLVKDALDGKVDGITFINSISDAISDGMYILTTFSLQTEDLEMRYGDGSQFVATLTDNGEPYAVGGIVTFIINNIEYFRKIDANGQAKLNVGLMPSADTYTITTEFRGKINTNTITIGA